MPALKHDVTKTLWGSEFTLPAGTDVHLIKGASGVRGDMYAVTSVKLLTQLTGNDHDPKYRYCFVEHSDVDESV